MTDESIGKEGVMSWTEDRVDLLRKLWLEGLSASRIAAELAGGVTRNAVIGKVHRLGMSGRVKAPVPASATPRRGGKPTEDVSRQTLRPATPVRGQLAKAIQDQPVEAPHPYRSGSDNVVAFSENVTIMDLRESMCRWPVGDPSSAEFRYCGGRAPIGEGPYCTLHSRMAYQPAQDRRARKVA